MPWREYALSVKAELEQQSPWPLDLQEQSLLTTRFNSPGPEELFVAYLRSLYSDNQPDIVISIGGPAARFLQQYRAKIFPTRRWCSQLWNSGWSTERNSPTKIPLSRST